MTITSDDTITTISLFDILGNQVSVLHPNSRKVTINVADLVRGVYIAKISTHTRLSSIKLMIE